MHSQAAHDRQRQPSRVERIRVGGCDALTLLASREVPCPRHPGRIPRDDVLTARRARTAVAADIAFRRVDRVLHSVRLTTEARRRHGLSFACKGPFHAPQANGESSIRPLALSAPSGPAFARGVESRPARHGIAQTPPSPSLRSASLRSQRRQCACAQPGANQSVASVLSQIGAPSTSRCETWPAGATAQPSLTRRLSDMPARVSRK
jgi:hypothetical protein